jgi:hypothetical protein
MLSDAIRISHYLCDDKEVMNHARRMGERALQLGWEEEVIAACYLHESLQIHYDEYYETLQTIKDLDENVAKIIDKVTKKKNETWGQYYYRIYLVQEAAKVVWLDMLDTLANADEETVHRITDGLWRIYCGAYKHICVS